MIYLDNGATSFPKPTAVYDAVYYYMKYCGGSAGRSAHKKAREAMEKAMECRWLISEFMGATQPENIIFTKNATEGLNIIIKGYVSPGDKVTVSPMEHNSVMRPLAAVGAEINILGLKEDGSADIEGLENICESTKLVIINHVSNVSGVVNNINLAGDICKKKGIPLVIDCSQSAGHIKIEAKKLGASLVFPGHKGLLGPQGTGCVLLEGIEPEALMYGGTGSQSEAIIQPRVFPDYYESGTVNVAGITGLAKGIEFIKKEGQECIFRHEHRLTERLREELANIKGVNLLCPKTENYSEVVSFTVEGIDPSEIALLLDEQYEIAVRSGLHCAPFAHKAYGTIETGTVRISPGYFNTMKDIIFTIDAINNIVRKRD